MAEELEESDWIRIYIVETELARLTNILDWRCERKAEINDGP